MAVFKMVSACILYVESAAVSFLIWERGKKCFTTVNAVHVDGAAHEWFDYFEPNFFG